MKSSRLAVLGLLLLLLVPTNSSAQFDGFPFSSWWEVMALTGFLLFVASRQVRRHALAEWGKVNTTLRSCIIGGTLLAVAVKCAVFLLSPTAGQFEVCYRSFSSDSGVPCIRTFEPIPALASNSEHFLQRSTETAVVDFGPRRADSEGISDSTWRLPFINSFEFDGGYWPWVPAEFE